MNSFNHYNWPIFILVSFIVHASLFVLMQQALENWNIRQNTPPPVWVNLHPLSPKTIVDTAKPKDEVIPDNVTARSRYDNKTDRETVNITRPQKRSPQPKAQKPQKDTKLFNKLYASRHPKTPTRQKQPAVSIPGIPEPYLSPSTPQAGDFLPGFQPSLETNINTRAHPDLAPYIIEMKRKFKLTWNPIPYIRQNYTQVKGTKVEVVMDMSLNEKGELMFTPSIAKNSGLVGYDREALRTIQASAPFSSPPEKLKNQNGIAQMRWHFTLYL